jgi:N-acyl-D-amino-acid deacylase
MTGRRIGAFCLGAALLGACGGEAEYDVIFRNGIVIDGTGRARFEADVAISGGSIARVGDLSNVRATEDIDVSGLFVAPGFINLHSHNRLGAVSTAANMLGQGVTTIILNADGGGPLDLSEQMREAEANGLAINVGPTIGFNSVWTEVNGRDDSRPSESQLEQMRALIQSGLETGAWGVSAGLDYKPAYYARTEEVIEVLAGTARWRTIFTNHDRVTPESGFSSRVGMQETIDIGEATGLTPVITHMKIQGREQGTSDEVLAMMTAATERGTYTAADVYPYLAGQTSLGALIIPAWAQAGTQDEVLSRFSDPAVRARIVAEADAALDARFGGPSGVFLPETRRELTDIMAEMGTVSGGEAVVRIIQEAGSSPSAILRFGSEDDLAAIMSYPTASIACDCDPASGGVGHPRYFGTFPRVLGRYVREMGVLTLEDAVRKMTGLPASTVGMVDRGYLAAGMAADIVVFDPATIIDHATFTDPTAASDGVRHVLVNGVWAVREGEVVAQRAGRALMRSENMPARPMDLSDGRVVEIMGRMEGVGDPTEVVLSVTQGAEDASASGEVRVDNGDGDSEFVVTRFGVLQTTREWASFTGRVLVAEDDERGIVVIVDAADPIRGSGGQGSADGVTLVLLIEGMEPIEGRMASDAAVWGTLSSDGLTSGTPTSGLATSGR